MKLLSAKFGEGRQTDGRMMSDDPDPFHDPQGNGNDNSFSDDSSLQLDDMKG